MAFRVGQKIGGYEFLRAISTSGAAPVFEVFNEREQRAETLKLLPKTLQFDPLAVERFLREAKIRAALSHPHIAAFYRGFTLEGELVMTGEACDGPTLEGRLEEGPLTMTEAIDIASRTLDALDYAHRAGVVHREVTPANIYLAPGGVKLGGFALARQTGDPRLTQPGLVNGSVHYMSPEQVKGLGEIGGRSDLYSLGVVLFEMVTGAKPFDSRSQFDIMQAHAMSPPPRPRDLRDDVPEELSGALLRALEKLPEERFATAAEFRAALEPARAIVAAREAAERPPSVRAPIDEFEERAEIATAPVFDPPARVRRPARLTVPAGPPAVPAAAPFAAPAGAGAATAAGEGWSTRDLAIVAVLTFVMVIGVAATLLLALRR